MKSIFHYLKSIEILLLLVLPLLDGGFLLQLKSSKTPFHSFLGLTDEDEYLMDVPTSGEQVIENKWLP